MCSASLEKLDDLSQQLMEEDPEIEHLQEALRGARNIPLGKKKIAAVLGERGTGKNSSVNEVVGRPLVDVSAGTDACTSYATCIKDNLEADIDKTLSDIDIEFLTDTELEDCISVQAAHRVHGQEVLRGGGLSEADEQEAENEVSTADTFFSIVFAMDNMDEVHQALDRADIPGLDFQQHALTSALGRTREVQSQYADVDDADLQPVRESIHAVYPLVKVITISTGYPLLHQNVVLLDLPGRTLIQASCDIVANSSRLQRQQPDARCHRGSFSRNYEFRNHCHSDVAQQQQLDPGQIHHADETSSARRRH